ncbi:RICIN domain-containing protein [Deinococcus antarcticus]|uniref:RICIN domain-containing protein n=1 Tax=Deinococcus antarcticus TaxID=1298767 RepID=A0ABV8ABC9_9DEIO
MKKFALLSLVPLLLASCGGQADPAPAPVEKVTLAAPSAQEEAASKAQAASSKLQAQAIWTSLDYVHVAKNDRGMQLNYNTGVGKVNIWSSSASDPDQMWDLLGYDNGAFFLLRRSNTNLCLNLHRPYAKNGQPVNLWSCNPGDVDQRWSKVQTYTDPGRILFQATGTNYCLNVYGRYSGAPVNVWTCNTGDSDQRWDFYNY